MKGGLVVTSVQEKSVLPVYVQRKKEILHPNRAREGENFSKYWLWNITTESKILLRIEFFSNEKYQEI